jgi:hypothetical protein
MSKFCKQYQISAIKGKEVKEKQNLIPHAINSLTAEHLPKQSTNTIVLEKKKKVLHSRAAADRKRKKT